MKKELCSTFVNSKSVFDKDKKNLPHAHACGFGRVA